MQLRARSTLREGSGTINLYWLMLATWNIRSYIRNKEKEEREKATGCVCLSCWPSCGSSDTRRFRFDYLCIILIIIERMFFRIDNSSLCYYFVSAFSDTHFLDA